MKASPEGSAERGLWPSEKQQPIPREKEGTGEGDHKQPKGEEEIINASLPGQSNAEDTTAKQATHTATTNAIHIEMHKNQTNEYCPEFFTEQGSLLII